MLSEFELEFETESAHFHPYQLRWIGDEMLYQDRVLGRSWIGARLASRLAVALGRKRYADLDLLSMSAHLRRDMGLDARGPQFLGGDVWRK